MLQGRLSNPLYINRESRFGLPPCVTMLRLLHGFSRFSFIILNILNDYLFSVIHSLITPLSAIYSTLNFFLHMEP